MATKDVVERAVEQGQGILRLAPTWVPRSFCVPGRRLKLHPADYYALGAERGGIDERWFSSTTVADNGPGTPEDEGLSYIVFEDGDEIEKITLVEAVAELGSELVGQRLWDKYEGWPVYSKFFDNKGALPFHIHQRDHHAALVGKKGKPEAYYFPPQMNNYGADFPYTFFGFQPGVTRDQLLECLKNFTKGDNRITDLSAAYRLKPGTGWDIAAGILHAPGSFCTYEPQWASDVFAMYQSVTGDAVVEESLLWKDSPPEKIGDYYWLLELVDWEANADPDFVANHFMEPKPVIAIAEMGAEGYSEKWICYRSTAYSAKELTVFPGQTVTIKDAAAYGLIMVQGHGNMGVWDIETPTMILFGQLTYDEFFVTETAAREGVVIQNPSKSDPIVMLKHFGPDNPDLDLS
jgi:hypothetical protein